MIWIGFVLSEVNATSSFFAIVPPITLREYKCLVIDSVLIQEKSFCSVVIFV